MKTNTLDFDAQALRDKILDLAMRGKLVPQDPNDEPASVLLEKIKAEKAELVKEKKIKKSKPLPEITDDEKPFDIPDSWEWVRLGEVGNYIQRGRSPKYDKKNKSHPIISQKCVQWENIYLKDAKYITKTFFDKLEDYRFVQENDVLWNSTGTGTVGRLNIVKQNLDHIPVDSHVTLIRMNKQVNPDYIYYYLRSPEIQDNLNDYLTGTTKQKELGLTNILKVKIPLPPLSEQSRIAAKIAQLFALLRKVETSTQQYAKLQTLLKSKVLDLAMRGKLVKQDPNDEPASVLLEKIKAEKAEIVKEKKIKKSKPLPPITDEEKPFDIPDSWEWVRLGNIVSYQNGYAYKSSELVKIRKGLPVIKSQNIMTLKVIIKDNNDYVKEPNEKMLNSKIIKGDLLMCLSSQSKNPEPLGKPAIYDLDKPALLNQRVLKLKLINHSMTDLIYYFINSSWFHFTVSHRGSGSGQSNLKLGDVMNMPIPVPPLNEEKHIVNRIEILFKKLSN